MVETEILRKSAFDWFPVSLAKKDDDFFVIKKKEGAKESYPVIDQTTITDVLNTEPGSIDELDALMQTFSEAKAKAS